jgi:hypothetical protein
VVAEQPDLDDRLRHPLLNHDRGDTQQAPETMSAVWVEAQEKFVPQIENHLPSTKARDQQECWVTDCRHVQFD